MVAVTGARASEVLGLRWADLDFKKGGIHILPRLDAGEAGETKSHAFAGGPFRWSTVWPILMEAWRAETIYNSDTDFIFPLDQAGWKTAAYGRYQQTDYIHPAAWSPLMHP